MMTALPQTPELEAVARRCVWFKSPAEALDDPEHLIAHVLTFGMPKDVATLRAHVSDVDLAEALEHAPPGIYDGRSWSYWNWMLRGLAQAPPMPRRTFAAVESGG